MDLIVPPNDLQEGLPSVSNFKSIGFLEVLLEAHTGSLLFIVEFTKGRLCIVNLLNGVCTIVTVLGDDGGACELLFVLVGGVPVEDFEQIPALQNSGADVDLKGYSLIQRHEGEFKASEDRQSDFLKFWDPLQVLVFGVELPHLPQLRHLRVPQCALQIDVQDLEKLHPVLFVVQVGHVQLLGLLDQRLE